MCVMKNLNACVGVALLMLTLNSCQESELNYLSSIDENSTVIESHNDNTVSFENVAALFKGSVAGTRSTVDIDCICDEANDTLLYVYNKPEGGWIIFSTDNRVPAIVAESDSGSFSELMNNESAECWVKSIADDMKIIKKLDDKNLNFSVSEINGNKDFWKSESLQAESAIQMANINNGASTNGIRDTPLIPDEPRGHYEYASTSFFTEVYDSVPPMILTDWHQNYPYNKYCPYKTIGSGRAPAGCTVIAAGQILFFLHYNYGIPRTAPSKAYCNGNVDAENFAYDWAQTDYTSEIWREMYYDSSAAAPLIADIGRRLKTKYGNDGSSSNTRNLVSEVFAKYGVNATYSVYNIDKLKNSLINGLPVIVGAFSIDPKDNTKKVGHDFIADRYKRVRVRREAHYSWVYESSQNPSSPITDQGYAKCMPDSIVISYLSPEIDMIGMNWGYGWRCNNNSEWYSLTGDWIKNIDSYKYNYNLNRDMIYINSINLQGL